ncbi:MAG: outer membrane beta-barrel protein [Parvibaculaceae bacterium]|nr:outer membrane beta-barrel protein [Parvibaculaceae bacterium]
MGADKILLAVASLLLSTTAISSAQAAEASNIEAGLGAQCLIMETDADFDGLYGDTFCGAEASATYFFDDVIGGDVDLGFGIDGFVSLNSPDGVTNSAVPTIRTSTDLQYAGAHAKARIPVSNGVSLDLSTGYYFLMGSVDYEVVGVGTTSEDIEGTMWKAGANLGWDLSDAMVLNAGYQYGDGSFDQLGFDIDFSAHIFNLGLVYKF